MVINMCEYNNVPKIRFKGFTDVWEQRKLEDITQIVMGQSPDSINYTENSDDTVLIQGNADLNNGIVVPRIWSSQITKKSYPNDIIFTVRAPVGEIARNPYFATIGRGVASFKGNDFLYQSLIQKKENNYWNNISAGSTFDSINSDQLKNVIIDLPKNNLEQEKIGELFTNLDNLITLHQRKCDTLVNAKKSLLEKMFPKNSSNIPEIRFKEFTDVWEQRKLGDIGSTFTGLSGKTKEDFGHGCAKFITYMNVFSNPIATLDKTEPIEIDNKQNEVKYGDILFTTSSETPEEVGMSSVWLENKANIYLNSFCFGYRPIEKNNPYYMAYMLRANNFRTKMSLLAQGISRYNISKNAAMDIEIQLPKIKEQESIGKLFYEIDNLITLHQRKLEKLKNIKKSMLDKMFV